MNLLRSVPEVMLGGVTLLLALLAVPALATEEEDAVASPTAKVIALDLAAEEYIRVLGGPPETVTMHSGLVVLSPGTSVGIHNTENYEEILVVFEGAGEMVTTGGPTLTLKAGTVAYCPPRTEHNVFNVGEGPLRYLYVVANAE